MRIKVLWLTVFVLLGVTGSFAQENEGMRYIEVTGSSEIEVVPDEIHFLVEIKEYWNEEFDGKSKPENHWTKVPLAGIESEFRKTLARVGIKEESIRTQEVGDYWRERGKEFAVAKQFDIVLDDFGKINEIISRVNTKGINSMRIGELKNKNMASYRQKGKIEALKAARNKALYLVDAMGQELGEVLRIVEPETRGGFYPNLQMTAQSNVSMGGSENETFRVIRLRYEMVVRFAIENPEKNKIN